MRIPPTHPMQQADRAHELQRAKPERSGKARSGDVFVERAGRGRRSDAMRTERGDGSEVARTGGDKTRGVVRLLEAGHFKGVAAVRLSINFHDELSARRTARAAVELGSAIDDLTAGADDALASANEFATGDQAQALEAARTALAAALDEIGTASGNGEIDGAAMLAGAQAAFDELMAIVDLLVATPDSGELESVAPGEAVSDVAIAPGEAVSDVAIAPGEAVSDVAIAPGEGASDVAVAPVEAASDIAETVEADAEGTVTVGAGLEPSAPAEASSETLSAPASLASDLRQLFGDFLDSAQSTLDAVHRMPEFTPPAGNGVAFEKFVAMYREMTGAGEMEVNAPAEAEASGVDQLA